MDKPVAPDPIRSVPFRVEAKGAAKFFQIATEPVNDNGTLYGIN